MHVRQGVIILDCVCVYVRASAIKEAQWQAREERARQHYEKQLEEKKRKLEEQRVKEDKRRAAVEEKRRQKMEEDKVWHTRPCAHPWLWSCYKHTCMQTLCVQHISHPHEQAVSSEPLIRPVPLSSLVSWTLNFLPLLSAHLFLVFTHNPILQSDIEKHGGTVCVMMSPVDFWQGVLKLSFGLDFRSYQSYSMKYKLW